MRSSIEGQVIAIDAGGGEPAGDASERRIAAALADELAAIGAKPVVLEGDEPGGLVGGGARRERAVGDGVRLAPGRHRAARGRAGRCAPTSAAPPRTRRRASGWPSWCWRSSIASPGSSGRLEGLTDAILRETRMPAVQIQPCMTTADDVPGIARAVAEALRRFFAG